MLDGQRCAAFDFHLTGRADADLRVGEALERHVSEADLFEILRHQHGKRLPLLRRGDSHILQLEGDRLILVALDEDRPPRTSNLTILKADGT